MGQNKYLNAFKNAKSILEGIKNNIFKKEHVEAEAELRFDICKESRVKIVKGYTVLFQEQNLVVQNAAVVYI